MRESTQIFDRGSMQGTKHDENKPRMSLVPLGVLAEVIAAGELRAVDAGEVNDNIFINSNFRVSLISTYFEIL